MNAMLEIAILDYNAEEVRILKAESYLIEEEFGGEVGRYLEEELGFKLSEISFMYTNGSIEVNCYNGCPSGGLTVTENDINEL